jgi:signal transduction histidine kinase
MNLPIVTPNRRILVVDDNQAIHADYRKILGAPEGDDAALAAAEAKFLGTEQAVTFEVDAASQGEEGLQMVERSLAEGRPYAMAFVDMRMPPGWDGVETTKRIWQASPELQIVICTAFADCSWDEVMAELKPLDRLLILKKPFDSIEVLQLARALTEKWRLRQESKAILGNLEAAVKHRTRALEESQIAALNMMEDAVQNHEAARRALEDLQRTEAERNQLAAEFLRSQRMEGLGSLAGGIAHDLNNALAPVLLSVEILKLTNTDPDKGRILDTIYDCARRGADMVKQIVTFARGSEGNQGIVQPAHLVQEMIEMTRHTFPKGIQIRTAVAPNIWMLLGNPTQLHQILLNLCVNARDAMPTGGILTLGADNLRLDATAAEMSPDAKPGPYVILTVKDTGTGMTPEVRARLFEAFFTTKAPGKGTGLGLSTVHTIAKDHGGFLTVDSAVGQGTTFKVYLPAQPDTAPVVAVVARPALPKGNGELILVVDDEAVVRSIAAQTLEAYGYRVVTAYDGAQAVGVCAKHLADLQLLITDMAMPIMDGPATIRAVRTLLPRLKVMAASGSDVLSRSIALQELEVQGFLHKPYSADELIRTVHDVLQEKVPA